jgi:hypothetical protein
VELSFYSAHGVSLTLAKSTSKSAPVVFVE